MAEGKAKVNADIGLNVRSGAGTQYSRIGGLANGTTVTYYGEQNGWLQIQYNGKTGYICKQYTSITQAATTGGSTSTGGGSTSTSTSSGSVEVTCNVLNVRKGNSTSYGIIGTLSKGKVVSYSEEKGGWLKISYNGQEGWICKDYTKKASSGGNAGGSSSGGSTTTTTTSTLYVNTAVLNVRTGPGTGNSKIGEVTNGTKLTVVGEQNGWAKIQFGSGYGWVSKSYTSAKAPSSGDGGSSSGSTTAVSTGGVPLYAQGDSKWGGEYMGRSGKTIRQIGCAMTSTTMALNKTSGKSFTPKDMNTYLNKNGGYTAGGCIYWGTAAGYVGKNYTGKGYSQKTVDGELNAGRPVVISVRSEGH